MKKYAALLLSLGLLVSGSALAVGAIAVDDNVGDSDPGWGVSTGEDSEGAAKKAALKSCKDAGNNCKVVGWFKTCGAYASSKSYSGYGYGATKAAATAKALEVCGNNRCKVHVSECED